MKRLSVFIYGLACYAVFFATFLYAIGFIGNLIVPKSIDSVPQAPLGTALVINLLLLGVFAVQHSLMARPFFKRWWTRIIHPAAERSTYVLFSSLALILLFALWEPMGGVIWSLESPAGQWAAHAAYAFGWGLVLFSTCAINHFDLFGLRQTWAYARGREPEPLKFVQPWIYRVVRHPLYVGWFFVMWATPTMTVAHLVFALGTSIYMLVAIQFEEHDLQNAHPEYRDYKKRVPMLIPSLKRLFGTGDDASATEVAKHS
ncbi:MAG: isoprenylcysteine carboxylmethyltransferase family protein [Gammaproteobacteria bacterium]|nr:isoprenylcysteine carboxylmethyltransferase family protein [Gammaproteobacteria bacterium]